ncbi:MAG: hypothetical protein NTW16_06020, partial [Bacteroidetes bacterium]|nr:hypothetical protein [Bacteroidota bacterium]
METILRIKKNYQLITSMISLFLLQGVLLAAVLPFDLKGESLSVISEGLKFDIASIPTISGPASVCVGVAGNIYSTEQGMTNYNWSVSAGGTITEGIGTNSITVTWNVEGAENVTVTYNSATSPAVLDVTVTAFSTAGISLSASSNPVCAGSQVTFTATPSNGGSSPSFQWKVNGINVGINSSIFAYIPSNGDVVGCQLTSSLLCSSVNPVSAVPVTMVVIQNLPGSVSITASNNPVCIGTQVNFLAVPFNGGATPVYQWKVNGINEGTNSSGFTFTPSNGDVVSCQMTSSATCVAGNPSNSNLITMSVSPTQVVTISVNASANPVCQGIPVTFTATIVNGGTSPAYQWFIGETPAGATNASFTYTPNQGDAVSCHLTSSAACTSGNPAISNTVPMVVTQNQSVNLNIVASVNSVCQGNPVSFNAYP